VECCFCSYLGFLRAVRVNTGLAEASCDGLTPCFRKNDSPCLHEDLAGISYLHHGLLVSLGISEPAANRLARECGRSVTILVRHKKFGTGVRSSWSGDKDLVPALLLGTWDNSCAGDRQAVVTLTGKSDYFDYELLNSGHSA
jgi:hypothetical protein